jgi:hypothetical protein
MFLLAYGTIIMVDYMQVLAAWVVQLEQQLAMGWTDWG